MPRIVTEHPVLSGVSLVYLVGFSVYGLLTERAGALVYLVSMSLIMALVAFAHARVDFDSFVLRGLALWGFLHMAGGLIPVGDGVLYQQQLVPLLLRFDQAVHALGFGFATLAVWNALRRRLAPDVMVSGGLALIVALGGMGLGAINEMLEFLASRVQPETNVGGFVNTGWDLVFNLFGCCAAALWVRYGTRSRLPA